MNQTLFDANTAAHFVSRIQTLSPETPALWGKMNVAQMLAHCDVPMQLAHGEMTLKRGLIGFLFGKMAKRKLLGPNEFDKNSPTFKEAKMPADVNFGTSKTALIKRIQKFQQGGSDAIIKTPHPFFGPMTPDEWSTLQVKHLDHHLRQFGA